MDPSPPRSRFSARFDYAGNRPLTEADVASYRMRDVFRRALAAHLAHPTQAGKRPEEVRILDFGCNRGGLVAHLRAQGFRAYGVDVEESYLKEGDAYFASHYSEERPKEQPEEPIISLVRRNGRTLFPDAYFDIVLSEEVLEHVRDLGSAAAELARITRPGGIGVHAYPGRWRFVEPHLKLPLVHWLPDNGLKKLALRALVGLGLGKDFREFEGSSIAERADIFYEYLVSETFYTSNRRIVRCFERHGFTCETEGSSASNKVVLHTRRTSPDL